MSHAVRPSVRGSVPELARSVFAAEHESPEFRPGETPVPVTGKVFGPEEIAAGVDAVMDFWLTGGPHTTAFERALARRVGTRCAVMCNSGSSANLLAVSALTSFRVGDRRLRPGDEVITVAAGFPTTVAPLVQNGLIPVLLDVELGTYNVDPSQLHAAVGPKTKAIMLAHTLGNPFDVEAVREVARAHRLWLIEDTCDALGSRVGSQWVGTFGDVATLSFYPAHHITTGEGGAVLTKRTALRKVIESFRDWGRDCWCAPGCDDTCAKRFDWQLGDLPEGYDHKYTYSHIGYNLKSGDVQAAIGLAQLQRLDGFIAKRRSNFDYLSDGLADLSDYLLLPRASGGSEPSWFGFPLTVKKSSPLSRDELVRALNRRHIGTRLLFGGNLLRQPGFRDIQRRVPVSLERTDRIVRDTFWLGVWPGLTLPMLDYVIESMHELLSGRG